MRRRAELAPASEVQHAKPEKNRRKLRPREPIAALPLAVSDRTAPVLLGFRSPRAFRDFVRRHRLPFAADGRTVLVLADVVREKLAELGAGEATRSHGAMASTAQPADDDDELDDADDVLEALGLAAEEA